MNSYSVSVVGPAHNEETNIVEFVEKVSATFHEYNLRGEILVVDDCSTDTTAQLLDNLARENKLLKVVHNKINKGLTGAMQVGFKNATGEIIIMLPTDLESNPSEDIPKLLLPIVEEGYEFVIGWRQGQRSQNVFKRYSSIIFNFLVAYFWKIHLHDLGWIKAFRREVLSNIYTLRSNWHRYFAVFVAYRGYRIKEVKTNYYPRTRGASKFGKLGIARIPGALIDFMVVSFHIAFLERPMAFFGTTGIVFISLGICFGLYLLVLKIIIGAIGHKIPMIFCTMFLVFSGIQLLCFGLIGEMLITIRGEHK